MFVFAGLELQDPAFHLLQRRTTRALEQIRPRNPVQNISVRHSPRSRATLPGS